MHGLTSSRGRYLLSLKYLEAIKKVAALPGTTVKYVPASVSAAASAGSVPMGMSLGLMFGQTLAGK